jgi:hypothetical protein
MMLVVESWDHILYGADRKKSVGQEGMIRKLGQEVPYVNTRTLYIHYLEVGNVVRSDFVPYVNPNGKKSRDRKHIIGQRWWLAGHPKAYVYFDKKKCKAKFSQILS